MNQCKRVGIDVTKRCSVKCATCFYRWAPDFNTPYDRTLSEVMSEVTAARARGCDHVVLVGWGETSLWPHLIDMIKEVSYLGMTSSIITNGTTSTSYYEKMRLAGLNHLHVSVHGLDDTFDRIVGVEGAGKKQRALFEYLNASKWPWRMNMTIQQENYKQMADIAKTCLDNGCRHIIPLNFLPHYEWNDPAKLRTVAVHPKDIFPELIKVYDAVEGHNNQDSSPFEAMLTIRYFPMCHLPESLRKYVTNARYVLSCEYEWDYGSCGLSKEDHWKRSLEIGGSVSINTEPCASCGLRMHCGGWNSVYAAGFDGAGLHAIPFDGIDQTPGWLHDQNPSRRISNGRGWF